MIIVIAVLKHLIGGAAGTVVGPVR